MENAATLLCCEDPEITVFNTLASLVSLMLLSVLPTSPFTHHYIDDDAR